MLVVEIEKASHLFKRIVVDMERLYGAEHVGINVNFPTYLPIL